MVYKCVFLGVDREGNECEKWNVSDEWNEVNYIEE